MEGNPIELGQAQLQRADFHVHVAASVVRRDTGHVNARTEENKWPEMVKRQRHHSFFYFGGDPQHVRMLSFLDWTRYS